MHYESYSTCLGICMTLIRTQCPRVHFNIVVQVRDVSRHIATLLVPSVINLWHPARVRSHCMLMRYYSASTGSHHRLAAVKLWQNNNVLCRWEKVLLGSDKGWRDQRCEQVWGWGSKVRRALTWWCFWNFIIFTLGKRRKVEERFIPCTVFPYELLFKELVSSMQPEVNHHFVWGGKQASNLYNMNRNTSRRFISVSPCAAAIMAFIGSTG